MPPTAPTSARKPSAPQPSFAWRALDWTLAYLIKVVFAGVVLVGLYALSGSLHQLFDLMHDLFGF